MDLVTLVKFRQELIDFVNQLDIAEPINQASNKLSMLLATDMLKSSSINFDFLLEHYNEVVDQLNQAIDQLEEQIDDIGVNLYDESKLHLLFAENQLNSRENRASYSLDIPLAVDNKIRQHSDWHYPGLQVYPPNKTWIDTMVTSDPLYLVNHNIQFLREMIKVYPELYQRRLRNYVLNDSDFSALPQNQIGFILFWNILVYTKPSLYKHYLESMFSILRPGGNLLLNFNNCFNIGSAELAVVGGMSYASERLIRKLAESVGYEIVAVHNDEIQSNHVHLTHLSWAELRKPGTLGTVKAHQSMAQIMVK